MKRRNKEEIQQMRELVNSYLLSNGNDPHKAYDDYIKYFLTNNIMLPYYVKGLEDFVNLSKDKKHNDLLLMQAVKEEKELEEARNENKIKFENLLINLTFEEVKKIWNNKKEVINSNEKQSLTYLYISKAQNEFDIKELSNSDVRNLRNILN